MRIGPLEINWNSRRSSVLKVLKKKGAIRAIKFVKDSTGWGLKESKEYVDRIRYEEHLDGAGNKITP